MGIKRYKKGPAKIKKATTGEMVDLQPDQSTTVKLPAKTTSTSASPQSVSSPAPRSFIESALKSSSPSPKKNIDYFGFPVKLIYSDLVKAMIATALIFLFLFALNHFFHV